MSKEDKSRKPVYISDPDYTQIMYRIDESLDTQKKTASLLSGVKTGRMSVREPMLASSPVLMLTDMHMGKSPFTTRKRNSRHEDNTLFNHNCNGSVEVVTDNISDANPYSTQFISSVVNREPSCPYCDRGVPVIKGKPLSNLIKASVLPPTYNQDYSKLPRLSFSLLEEFANLDSIENSNPAFRRGINKVSKSSTLHSGLAGVSNSYMAITLASMSSWGESIDSSHHISSMLHGEYVESVNSSPTSLVIDSETDCNTLFVNGVSLDNLYIAREVKYPMSFDRQREKALSEVIQKLFN